MTVNDPSTPETAPDGPQERLEGGSATPAPPDRQNGAQASADGLGDGREPDDTDEDWAGPLIPTALMDAIHQVEAQQKQDAEALAALPFTGPTIAEAVVHDRRWWNGEKAGEGQ